MIIDREQKLSAAQAVTTSAASTNVFDASVARDLGPGEQLWLAIQVTEAALASGAATVTFALQTDSDEAFGTVETLQQTAAIGKATLIVGYEIKFRLPIGLKRYTRLYYTVATGPLTAGKFNAFIVKAVDAWRAYPNAVSF